MRTGPSRHRRRHDHRGRPRRRSAHRAHAARSVDTGNSESGTTTLWGRLYAHDATVLDRRLAAMAHGVCDDDPRTLGQRRADALAALAAGAGQLACACDNPRCPTRTGSRDASTGAVVVYVVADSDSIDCSADPQHDGRSAQSRPQAPAAARDPEPVVRAKPAQIVGGWASTGTRTTATTTTTSVTFRTTRNIGRTAGPTIRPGRRPNRRTTRGSPPGSCPAVRSRLTSRVPTAASRYVGGPARAS